MTAEEKAELNRRVAVAMGWEVGEGVTGWRWFNGQIPISSTWPTKGGCERHPPDYCTDPSAAALVMAEIERRGWGWGLRTIGDNYDCHIHRPGTTELSGWGLSESPWHALCLAFLDAHEAQKEREP